MVPEKEDSRSADDLKAEQRAADEKKQKERMKMLKIQERITRCCRYCRSYCSC